MNREYEPSDWYGGGIPDLVLRWDIATGKPRPVDPRLDLCNHSPTGLTWGYGGSGPAQTALAILADATGDDDLAVRWYQQFKRDFVETWPMGEPWILSRRKVLAWVETQARLDQLAF